MKRHLNECKGLDPPMPPSSQGLATPPTASQESARAVVVHPRRVAEDPNMQDTRKRVIIPGNRDQPFQQLRRTLKACRQAHDPCMAGASQESMVESTRQRSQQKKKSKSHKKDKSSK